MSAFGFGTHRGLWLLLALALSTSCARPRSKVPENPNCRLPRDHAPWIVNWPDRISVISAMGQGPILVRYVGCELEILRDCRARRQESYLYVGLEPSTTAELLTDGQQLFRKLPVEAPALEQARNGADVRLRVVTSGAWRTDPHPLRAEELQGDCQQATHHISGVVLGSYQLSAIHATSASAGSSLGSDGEQAACERASSLDRAPPAGCAGPVRLELSPVTQASKSVAADEPWISDARKGSLARVLTLTTIASVVSLAWGAGKVYSSRKAIDEHCAGKACDQEGMDAAASGRTGAYLVNAGLAGTAVSLLGLTLLTGGGSSHDYDEEARARTLPRRTWVAGGRAEEGSVAATRGPTQRVTPWIHPHGAMVGWEARF